MMFSKEDLRVLETLMDLLEKLELCDTEDYPHMDIWGAHFMANELFEMNEAFESLAQEWEEDLDD